MRRVQPEEELHDVAGPFLRPCRRRPASPAPRIVDELTNVVGHGVRDTPRPGKLRATERKADAGVRLDEGDTNPVELMQVAELGEVQQDVPRERLR